MCLEEGTSGRRMEEKTEEYGFVCMWRIWATCISVQRLGCVSLCGVTGVSMWRKRWGWCGDRDVCVCVCVCVCVTGEMWVLCRGRESGDMQGDSGRLWRKRLMCAL